LLIFHVFLSLVLVVAILLQAGRGGGLAAAFGGGGPTETVFGGRGAATFITKLTQVVGVLFFLTSFTLAFMSRRTEGPSSLIEREMRTTTEPAPYVPGELPLEEGAEQTAPAEQPSGEQAQEEQPAGEVPQQ
jgi:preprotein translocase subunit SecG